MAKMKKPAAPLPYRRPDLFDAAGVALRRDQGGRPLVLSDQSRSQDHAAVEAREKLRDRPE